MKSKRIEEVVSSISSNSDDSPGKTRLYIDGLKEGSNFGAFISLKAVTPAISLTSGTPPLNFVCMDGKGECIAISLYHLDEAASSSIGSDDLIMITDPMLKIVGSAESDSIHSYKTLQVLQPESIRLNGKQLLNKVLNATSVSEIKK